MILKDKYSSDRPPSPLSRSSLGTPPHIRQDIQYTYVGDGVPAVEIPRYI